MGVAAAFLGGAFLIDAATQLQSESKDAVEEATAEKSPPLRVVELRLQSAPDGRVSVLELVTPSISTAEVDLRRVPLTLEIQGQRLTYTYAAEPNPGAYTAKAVRDADESFNPAAPLLNDGDLVQLLLSLPADTIPPTALSTLTQIQGTASGGLARQTVPIDGRIQGSVAVTAQGPLVHISPGPFHPGTATATLAT